jgi:thiol-disulfide isomerase/thioredoxin
MRHKFLIPAICILAILTLFSLFSIKYSKANHKIYLPVFSFLDSDKKLLNSNSLLNYKGYCIVLFNTDCEICQAEAEIISKAKNMFKDNCFILLSPEPDSTINAFISIHKLKSSNVFVLSVPLDSIMQKFDGRSAPYVFIYNKNKELIHKENTSHLGIFKKFWGADN